MPAVLSASISCGSVTRLVAKRGGVPPDFTAATSDAGSIAPACGIFSVPTIDVEPISRSSTSRAATSRWKSLYAIIVASGRSISNCAANSTKKPAAISNPA
ncbi:hypothetical protein BamMEX5DRAFT_1567 [Burkholderia ambifaria MEX-5]|uniref:Uncharacterized protein n=1 Tax=Burkholderia ambifaria MEX-5 TaxID=396597 RepID=B1T1A1_9BURK|nr:hypothetical protein BamMEX5DRAFT_1567 [Burkholderia ambifaria MEX-5]